MWVNGFRLSSICGNFVNELSRYSVMNLISMFYVIGVNCGVNLNNFMVIVDNNYMVGSCMVVVLIMVGSLLLMLLMVMLQVSLVVMLEIRVVIVDLVSVIVRWFVS